MVFELDDWIYWHLFTHHSGLQSVIALSLSDVCGFVDVVCSLWREDGSVVYNCSWPSPAQSFSDPSPVGLVTIFYCLKFETSFRRVLQLAGLRWRYSTPPPPGLVSSYIRRSAGMTWATEWTPFYNLFRTENRKSTWTVRLLHSSASSIFTAMRVHRTVAHLWPIPRFCVNYVNSGATNSFDGPLSSNGRFVLLD
jgi:hypothetical protein